MFAATCDGCGSIAQQRKRCGSCAGLVCIMCLPSGDGWCLACEHAFSARARMQHGFQEGGLEPPRLHRPTLGPTYLDEPLPAPMEWMGPPSYPPRPNSAMLQPPPPGPHPKVNMGRFHAERFGNPAAPNALPLSSFRLAPYGEEEPLDDAGEDRPSSAVRPPHYSPSQSSKGAPKGVPPFAAPFSGPGDDRPPALGKPPYHNPSQSSKGAPKGASLFAAPLGGPDYSDPFAGCSEVQQLRGVSNKWPPATNRRKQQETKPDAPARPANQGRQEKRPDASTCAATQGTQQESKLDAPASAIPSSSDQPLDLAASLHGDTKPTTMMLCNIPCRVATDKLREVLDELGFEGTYDFAHMPHRNGKKTSNVGYAFVNFFAIEDAQRFASVFEGYRFEGTLSTKVCTVKVAELQGFDGTSQKRSAVRPVTLQ